MVWPSLNDEQNDKQTTYLRNETGMHGKIQESRWGHIGRPGAPPGLYNWCSTGYLGNSFGMKGHMLEEEQQRGKRASNASNPAHLAPLVTKDFTQIFLPCRDTSKLSNLKWPGLTELGFKNSEKVHILGNETEKHHINLTMVTFITSTDSPQQIKSLSQLNCPCPPSSFNWLQSIPLSYLTLANTYNGNGSLSSRIYRRTLPRNGCPWWRSSS